jgi:hypothetical protein
MCASEFSVMPGKRGETETKAKKEGRWMMKTGGLEKRTEGSRRNYNTVWIKERTRR